jgi:hypothetical protein
MKPLLEMIDTMSRYTHSVNAAVQSSNETTAQIVETVGHLKGAALPLPCLFEPGEGGLRIAALAHAEAAARRHAHAAMRLAEGIAALRKALFAVHKAGQRGEIRPPDAHAGESA